MFTNHLHSGDVGFFSLTRANEVQYTESGEPVHWYVYYQLRFHVIHNY